MAFHKAGDQYYEEVRFQEMPALFTSLRLDAKSIPKGMYRYEIRYDEETYEPCQLANRILVNHYGTLLTNDPIQLPVDGYLDFEPGDMAFVPNGCRTIDLFQQDYLAIGKTVMEFFPMKREEAPLFFSKLEPSEDMATGCIGHVRGDFDPALHTTWWPHYWDQALNRAPFKEDIQRVMEWLKTGFSPLKDLETMDAFCRRYEHCRIPGQSERCYGFRIDSGQFRYMLRCTPLEGWYHVYLYCYSKSIPTEQSEE